MKKRWISINVKPVWIDFAWFGKLKMKHVKTGKTVTVNAAGVYCDNGRNMEFRISNWDENRNLDDYDITHYITRPDKVPDLFNTRIPLFPKQIKQ